MTTKNSDDRFVEVDGSPYIHDRSTGRAVMCDACEINEALAVAEYTTGWHPRCGFCDEIDRDVNGY